MLCGALAGRLKCLLSRELKNLEGGQLKIYKHPDAPILFCFFMLLADFSALSIRLPVLAGIKLGGKIDTPTFHTFKRIFLSNQSFSPLAG